MGSIILLILIIVGIVFGARLFLNKKKSSVPSPTLTQRSGAHVWVVPAALESSLLLSVKGSQGQYAHSQMIMRVEGSTALAVIHFL